MSNDTPRAAPSILDRIRASLSDFTGTPHVPVIAPRADWLLLLQVIAERPALAALLERAPPPAGDA
jgi:hypothetical protein